MGWRNATNGGNIYGLEKGMQIGKNMIVQYRVNLTSDDSNKTPWVKNLVIVLEKDITPPIIEINPFSTEWTNNPIVLTATATDEFRVAYMLTPSGTVVNDAQVSYVVQANGEYTFVAFDLAQNKSSRTVILSNIDMDAPKLGIEELTRDSTRIDVQLNYSD